MASRFANVLFNLKRLQLHRSTFLPIAQCALSAFNILRSLPLLRDEYQFPLNFLISIFDSATNSTAPDSGSKLIYASKNGTREGMKSVGKRGKEDVVIKRTSELLGVNLEKMTNALKSDGKEHFNMKGD